MSTSNLGVNTNFEGFSSKKISSVWHICNADEINSECCSGYRLWCQKQAEKHELFIKYKQANVN